jgi:hypothetical protein
MFRLSVLVWEEEGIPFRKNKSVLIRVSAMVDAESREEGEGANLAESFDVFHPGKSGKSASLLPSKRRKYTNVTQPCC